VIPVQPGNKNGQVHSAMPALITIGDFGVMATDTSNVPRQERKSVIWKCRKDRTCLPRNLMTTLAWPGSFNYIAPYGIQQRTPAQGDSSQEIALYDSLA
jgi:hypothetical protein